VKIPYRADIDGLRALAVVAVVLFHAFPTVLPAGYIGVDIFFVISGFLITSILRGGLLDHGAGFLEFYERRVERLFPALIVVCLAVSIMGWLCLFPPELENLGKHLLGCLTFTSNFVLWNEAGYFDAEALLKPLRMLWSLAVEEQFYLVWPISLWYITKRRHPLIPLTIVACALSFGVCLFHANSDQVAAFYSPVSRMWEPLLGCLLALVQERKHENMVLGHLPSTSILNPSRANACGAAGTVLLLTAFFAIPGAARYPGLWALLPTLGAALLIAAGPYSVANQPLAWRPLVWIGRVSYPLYLWHWPVLSFMRIIHGDEPPLYSRAIAVLGSVLLAFATYALFEKPVSRYRSLPTALLLVGAFAVTAGATGYVFVKSAGLPTRPTLKYALPGAIGDRALNEYFEAVYAEFGPCSAGPLKDEAPRYHKFIRCFESKPGLPIDIAIVGDSHAEHLFLGIAEALPQKNVAMYMSGSIPLSSNVAFDHIYKAMVESKEIKTVVIASFWSPRNSRNIYPSDLDATLADTVNPLLRSGKKVYLTEDTPNFPFDASHCKYRRLVQWGPDTCNEDADFFRSQQRSYLPAFHRAEHQSSNLKVLKLSDLFCDDMICRMQLAGTLMFRDRDHLNVAGSRAVGVRLLQTNPELADQ
jgi:peptidoglycan/LPS O-acetylase OafA/YrhL